MHLPKGARIVAGSPLSIAETIAERAQHPDPEHDDDFQTPDGRVFQMSYEPFSIVELGSSDVPLRFATRTQLEQAWVDLQASFGVKSRLTSDPDWREFPEPTEPSIQ
jgi:hypothetical protein